MPHHIFSSWQFSLPVKIGHNLIERAQGDAIAMIKANAEVDPARRATGKDAG
jgi:hypothetical protein